MRVGIPVADLTAGLFCAHRHPDRAAGARGVRRGPVGADLAAAGADLHAGFPGRALADGKGRRQAGRQQPSDQHSRPACSRPPTATSTSPPRADGSGSAARRRSARPNSSTNPDYATAPARSKNRDALNADDRQAHREEIHRHLGQGTERRRRALRPDLFDRPDVRGRPGQASRHRPGRAQCREPPHPAGRPAGRRCRARRARWRRGRRSSASRPTRCWPSSVSAPDEIAELRQRKVV